MQPFTYISIFGYKSEAALKVIFSKLKVSVCSLLRDTMESDFAFLRVNFSVGCNVWSLVSQDHIFLFTCSLVFGHPQIETNGGKDRGGGGVVTCIKVSELLEDALSIQTS